MFRIDHVYDEFFANAKLNRLSFKKLAVKRTKAPYPITLTAVANGSKRITNHRLKKAGGMELA